MARLRNALKGLGYRCQTLADRWRPPDRSDRFVVAGMATMPTRRETLRPALASIMRQVDRLYLYLDGHAETPAPAKGDERIIILSSKTHPGLHANGKLLGLALEPGDFTYLCADDDIYYCHRYSKFLAEGLHRHSGRAAVGLHAIRLARPLVRYREGHTSFNFKSALAQDTTVDVIGTGTVAFNSSCVRFDVRDWASTNMVDLNFSLEAARRGLPLISLQRPGGIALPLGIEQSDSLYAKLKRDDSRHLALAHELLSIAAAAKSSEEIGDA